MSGTSPSPSPVTRPVTAPAAGPPAAPTAGPATGPVTGVDPRGQRFAAAVTAAVLAAVLVTSSPVLLAVQAAVFAAAVVLGVRRSPYALAYARLVHPRLGPPRELEDERLPRFAQGVGLAFAGVGLVGYLAGAATLGAVATGLALTAALLNAVLGLCLGCEMYLLLARLRGGHPRSAGHPA